MMDGLKTVKKGQQCFEMWVIEPTLASVKGQCESLH